jgi:hypothetical protein
MLDLFREIRIVLPERPCTSGKSSGARCFEVTIETPPKDLKTYVRSFIESQMPAELSENDLSFFDRLSSSLGWECYHHKTLVDKIIDAIAQCSQGILLLEKLYTNSLSCQPSLQDVKVAVTEMQERRRDLSETMTICTKTISTSE